ncbi:MAG: tetratricopeptide repeat protein [Thermoanaerobaculia bacterium]|nr:MAG: tetratricopeptide repeat protein [Thermoanaerobaculia bacterium]
MRLRSFLGVLLALGAVFAAYYLSEHNRELLRARFHLGPETTIPLSGALVAVFLIGFLPAGVTLVVDTLRRELAARRERRHAREQDSLDATLLRASDLAADGQGSRAATELEAYLAGRPDDLQGLLLYGQVLRGLGRVDEAVEVHRRASALRPGSVGVLYQLADDYLEKGDTDIAREIHGRILRDFPGFGLEISRRRRSEAIGRRDWAEAARLHERVTSFLNESGDSASLARESGLAQGLDYQRGVLLLEQDRAEEAAEMFRRLLRGEPRFIPARIMLGEAERLAGREEAAIAAWRDGYLETGSPVFLHRIEDHFIEEEEPVRAIETLRGLIAVASNDLLPRFYLGRLYYRLEMHDEAERTLAALGERIKSSPTYHYLLGRIRERRGDLEAASEAFLACVRQLQAGSAEYLCRVCHTRYPDWQDFCARCGSWNAVELDFEEERMSAEDLGVRAVPVWGVAEDSGEFAFPAPATEPES